LTTFKALFKSAVLRTILIDDEALMRRTIEKMALEHCPEISLVAQADSVSSGVAAIKRHHPDLVLLDIRMDDGTGFDLLRQLEPVDFKVIFITAYDDYAIKAIRFSALDYLLKPVDPDDLKQAVDKADKLVMKELNAQLSVLSENMQQGTASLKKIILKTYDAVHLVRVQDIVYCESDENYTTFHLADGSTIITSRTLKEYEEMLCDAGFFRVHKSYLINMSYITRFEKAEGGSVVLNNAVRVPVSSRKRELLLEMLDRISNNI
jgi:two-component system LytT family response regulator